MTESLKTRAELLEEFADGQEQGVTAEKQRDLIVSLSGVGAGENDAGGTPGTPVGLIRLGAKRFQVAPSGDGVYMFVGQGDANIDIEANVLVGFTVNGVDTTAQYIRRARFVPGDQNNNHIILIDRPAYDGWDGVSGPPLREGDIIELEFKPTGGSVLSNVRYFIFGVRLG
jgi:hypothetical protein